MRQRRADLLAVLGAAGVKNVRVFGSVGRGDDDAGSDLDLLVDLPEAFSLVDLAKLERDLSRIVGVPVDAVPSSGLRANVAQRALAEAVPL